MWRGMIGPRDTLLVLFFVFFNLDLTEGPITKILQSVETNVKKQGPMPKYD